MSPTKSRFPLSATSRILAATLFAALTAATGGMATALAGGSDATDSAEVFVIGRNKQIAATDLQQRVGSSVLILERAKGRQRLETAAAEPLAVLELQNGATLEFIDVGDNYVGIAERAPPGAPLLTKALVSRWKATPLEIYLALAPQGYGVPEALLSDHNLQRGRRDQDHAQPRSLSIPPTILFSLDDPGLEDYACDSFGWPWINDWEDAFDGITDHHPATYLHQNPNAYYFYPGAPVYYGSGTNRKTYLGACNGDAMDNLAVEIHRWAVTDVVLNPSPTPPTVIWNWVKIQEISLDSYTKYTFYSAHPTGRYRGRAEGEGGSVVEHYGLGAAWTKSFPLGLGS